MPLQEAKMVTGGQLLLHPAVRLPQGAAAPGVALLDLTTHIIVTELHNKGEHG